MSRPGPVPIGGRDAMATTIPTPHLCSVCPVDVVVPEGHHDLHQFQVLTDKLGWDGHWVRYDAITGVAYRCRQRSVNLVQRGFERRIHLTTATGELQIVMGDRRFGRLHEDAQHAAYRTVLAVLDEVVEPRLRGQLLRAMASGETVRIAGVELDHHHVTVTATREIIEWRQLPTAQLQSGQVLVRATHESRNDTVATIDMLATNAPVLPELLEAACLTFA